MTQTWCSNLHSSVQISAWWLLINLLTCDLCKKHSQRTNHIFSVGSWYQKEQGTYQIKGNFGGRPLKENFIGLFSGLFLPITKNIYFQCLNATNLYDIYPGVKMKFCISLRFIKRTSNKFTFSEMVIASPILESFTHICHLAMLNYIQI